MDKQTIEEFRRWSRRFRGLIRASDRLISWNTLVDRCDPGDLEWALFWAIDNINTASYAIPKLLSFANDSRRVRQAMSDFRPALQKLMGSKILGEPAWLLHFGFLQLTLVDAVRFYKFQQEVDAFYARLKQFPDGPRSSTITASLARAAEYGEVLLHVYVQECTGSAHYEQTSILLEAAVEAYNLEETRSFAEDAVSHRFRRFQSKYPDEVAEARDDIRSLRLERSIKGKQILLIPFLIARKKDRSLSIREHFKSRGFR